MTSSQTSAESPEAADAAPSERPNRRAIDSTQEWRINSTALKVNQAFEAARIEARDECLWLSKVCREVIADNDRLRVANEKLREDLAKAERAIRAPE